MKQFQVVSVNISERKGVRKTPVAILVLQENHGVVGDAHAGPGLRQVSLLASEDMRASEKPGLVFASGDFAENITTAGIDLVALGIGARITIGTVILEISQIGKECHTGCAIREQTGDCIMPRRGVFANVIKGGEITNESIGTYDF